MTKRLTLGAALLFLSLSVAKLLLAQGSALSGSQSKPPITGEDRDRLLAAGKKLRIQVQAAGAQVERTVLDELWEPLLFMSNLSYQHFDMPEPLGRDDAEFRHMRTQ